MISPQRNELGPRQESKAGMRVSSAELRHETLTYVQALNVLLTIVQLGREKQRVQGFTVDFAEELVCSHVYHVAYELGAIVYTTHVCLECPPL
jgi:hypothetical protein